MPVVSKGDILANLDPTDQQNQLRSAQGDLAKVQAQLINAQRSEERRVGKECLRLCRSRWSPYH